MRWLFGFVACLCLTLGQSLYDDEFVTCGSVLKLSNAYEGSRIHSHDIKYGSGSGQQSVTAVQASDDVNSHWQVYPPLEGSCGRGDPMKCGGKASSSALNHRVLSSHSSFPSTFIKPSPGSVMFR
ncbi:Stromal cell-derived factor 2-like protein 1 [Parelaphostrongylus tenuis]|uniref:Stromal cell-derived factor 2-like protein 1 n=1 Tax=Parelaphostrongylus tenuis TaxID=148309 RepID=A0AAD5RA04_PARTN|nr:Stromal cell-derived factor 2-like protein 1 [Parelaphostrongylus tenuis]